MTTIVSNFDVLNLLFGYITRSPIKGSDNENFLIYELANNGPQFFGQFKYSPKRPEGVIDNLAPKLAEIPIPDNLNLIKYTMVSFPLNFFQAENEDISKLVENGWIEPCIEKGDTVYAITYSIHNEPEFSKLGVPTLGSKKEKIWAIPPAWFYAIDGASVIDFYPKPEPVSESVIVA